MLYQTKYNSITILLTSSSEQSMLVECPSEPKQVAILHSYTTNAASQLIQLVKTQIDRLLPLRHPHLQSVIDVFSEDHSLHIVQGLAEGKLSATLAPLKAKYCEKILSELLTVIIYLHDRDIVHGNISSETIMIDSQYQSILTNFKTMNDLVSAAKGEVTNSALLERLSKIPVNNIPHDEQFDLYSLGLTIIYLLTDRELEYLYDRDTQQWRYSQNTDCSEKLIWAIEQLISSHPISAREILAELKSPPRTLSDSLYPSQQAPNFHENSIPTTFIELPNNLNDPVYFQAAILGCLTGSIWIVLHSLISWSALETGILGMVIGGLIYWRYRSAYKIKQLFVITLIVSISMMLIVPLRQKLPIITKIDHPGLFDLVLFLIACGLLNFAVFILAGFIYRILLYLVTRFLKK